MRRRQIWNILGSQVGPPNAGYAGMVTIHIGRRYPLANDNHLAMLNLLSLNRRGEFRIIVTAEVRGKGGHEMGWR